jgi:hypothetical protein
MLSTLLHLPELLLAPLLSVGAILAVPEVTVEPATGAVAVTATGEPLRAVLDALRRETGVQLIVDADVEPRAVTLSGRYVDARAAVRAAAQAARAATDEAGGIILVRRVRPGDTIRGGDPGGADSPRDAFGAGAAGRTSAAAVTLTVGRDGWWRAPGALGYPVAVLHDRPEDATVTAALSGFEGKPGVGLISAHEIQERAVREYLEARPLYRAIIARAGAAIRVRDDIEQRWVRVYVEPGKDRMYAEVLYAQDALGGRSEIVHMVFVMRASAAVCDLLVIFKKPV